MTVSKSRIFTRIWKAKILWKMGVEKGGFFNGSCPSFLLLCLSGCNDFLTQEWYPNRQPDADRDDRQHAKDHTANSVNLIYYDCFRGASEGWPRYWRGGRIIRETHAMRLFGTLC